MDCCCCCFPSIPESSRTIDEHVPLSLAPPSSVVTTTAGNRNLVPNIYTSPIPPPIPITISPRNHQTPPVLPITQSQSNSSEGITQGVQEKEKWHVPVDDLTDLDDLKKKKDRDTIDECPICLEEYDIENPKCLTKCGHDFHLACILEWMERSEVCPVCDKELEITES